MGLPAAFLVLVKAHQIQHHAAAQLPVELTKGGKQLRHALFLHDPAQIEKTHCPVVGVRQTGTALQIHTGTGQHPDAAFWQNAPVQKDLGIGLIFKKDRPRTGQAHSVQHRHQCGQAPSVESGPQPLDIGAVWNACQGTGQTGVYIRLDGVGDDQIRLFPPEQRPVFGQ